MVEHSKYFSPSGMSRVLKCPGSAKLCAELPDTQSDAARDGTIQHEFCEKNIHAFMFNSDLVDYSSLDKKFHGNVKSAMQMVKDLCDTNGAHVQALEYNNHIDGMDDIFGTMDVVLWSKDNKHMLVVDYKFGYNPVAAEWNTQLLIYAIIARRIFNVKPETVTLAIIQPKVHESKPDLFTLPFREIQDWSVNNLLPVYNGVNDGSLDNTFNPGEEQCRWCKAQATCPALKDEVMDALNYQPTEDKLGDLIGKVSMIREWCASIEARVLDALQQGKPVPGYKLVRGRANRRWKDPEAAEKWLRLRKFKEKDRFVKKVIGIPAAEALIKGMALSKKLQNSFSDLIEKPEGKLTYAKADDPRQEVIVETAEETLKDVTDFSDLI
ncbi:MAG: DUF2800 domain-containing protein [Desulfobacteraceae bacterium]|jgi:hypothetical protein